MTASEERTRKILDRISPDEAHLPPSLRTWARIIALGFGYVLEMRDPNSGQSSDPADKPRYQYYVHRGRLWSRRLPPAPLEQVRDETPWRDSPVRWELVEPGSGIPWEWATAQGVEPYPTHPVRVEGEWASGTGDPSTIGYVMPARDPWNAWADVTSYADSEAVPCPECGQDLVWYEAGYVPGYRVCMARLDAERHDHDSIRHRWLWWDGVLVLR